MQYLFGGKGDAGLGGAALLIKKRQQHASQNGENRAADNWYKLAQIPAGYSQQQTQTKPGQQVFIKMGQRKFG